MGDLKSKTLDWGLPLAILGAITAVVLAVARLFDHWWITAIAALWVVLMLIALVKTLEQKPRDYIEGALREKAFTQIYSYPTERVVDYLWSRLCDPLKERSNTLETAWAALSWKLYDRALLLATVYPILCLLIVWVGFGQDGRLGTSVILPAAPFWPDRAATLFAIAFVFASWPLSKWAAASPKRFMRSVSGWLPLFAFAFTVAGAAAAAAAPAVAAAVAFGGAAAVAFAFAAAVAFAGAAAVAFAVAFAFAFAGAAAFAGLAAVAFAFAVAVAIERLDEKSRQGLARLVLTLLLPMVWVVVFTLVPVADISQQNRGLFLFLGVLPLLNAIFDFLSYAATLTLMRLGLSAKQPMLYGACDIIVALVLFLGLGVTLTVVIAGLNQISGGVFVDLGALFGVIYTDPHAYWWLYAMVFSTALPTTLHGVLTLLAAQALVPLPVRRIAANLVDRSAHSPQAHVLAPLAVGTIWLIPFLVLGGFGWLVWHYCGSVIETLAEYYLGILLSVAMWIGAF
ncbi:hypothetical protein GN278_11695 [Rhodobacteraceae bacterium Araon29]